MYAIRSYYGSSVTFCDMSNLLKITGFSTGCNPLMAVPDTEAGFRPRHKSLRMDSPSLGAARQHLPTVYSCDIFAQQKPNGQLNRKPIFLFIAAFSAESTEKVSRHVLFVKPPHARRNNFV